MKYISRFITAFICFSILLNIAVFATAENGNSLNLTEEEKSWLASNKNRTFVVGIDSYTGIEYFKINDVDYGYMDPLLRRISSDLGIDFKLEASKSWNEVYSGLQNGTIDILGGANETPERKQIMEFTKPLLKNPYAIIAKKQGPIQTIGDIDMKTVGFIEGDFIIDNLPDLYKNINYEKKVYSSQDDGIKALIGNEIDAFITSGNPSMYDYIYEYPELKYAFKINSITSDMTFSTRKEDKILAEILDKEIAYLQKDILPEMINKAEIKYNIKVMKLSDEEQKWLNNYGTAVVGVTKNYLPFDYYVNGDFKGIDGKLIKEISRMTGIKFKYYYSDFDDLEQKLKTGEVNVLNIAKTKERLDYVIYPQPFSTERDIIVGRKDEKDVRDIFGLEGKSVAVIKGFWHYEMLRKNLTNVKIIETNNVKESMKLVHNGTVDFLIENPTVVRFYMEELQYYDLVQRGETSTDSFLYLGVSKNRPELASIINKTISMIDMSKINQQGYEEVPHENYNQKYQRLIGTIVVLVILLFVILAFSTKLIRALIREKTEKELLKQKGYLLSIDSLTELYNRNYFNTKVLDNLDNYSYPQVLIVADMNNLKTVNDKYGHQAGDSLLKLFSDVLREACPPESILIRMGGDEFFIILENSSEEKAIGIIKSINETSKARTIVFNHSKPIEPTAALGYSIRYSSKMSFDELYKTADMRMYQNKRKTKVRNYENNT